LDKRILRIPINEIVTPDYKHIVKGEGMPTKNNQRGDMIIQFKMEFPQNLTDDQRNILTKVLMK